MPRGRFIVLEGIDGSGTTSQARALTQELQQRGHRVLATHEPSDGSIGRAIREHLRGERPALDPAALALLFAADRLDHVRTQIEPALSRGEIVICDRYVVSSWIYQSLTCDQTWVRTINRHAPWPDLTLVLQVPASEALRRVHGRDQAREIFENEATQRAVAEGYEAVLAEGLPDLIAIDGTPPEPAVTAAAIEALQSRGL